MKKVFLYLMAFIYMIAGVYHFVNPVFYINIMPDWLPDHNVLNSLAGVFEIVLALMLLKEKTRRVSSLLIIAMLTVFLLLIHIPMTVDFYQSSHPALWVAVIRLPIQFVLIWWAWLYTRPERA